MTHDVFYFGCWGEPGHFLWSPGGGRPAYKEAKAVVYIDLAKERHIDGSLAPRRHRDGNRICWSEQATHVVHRSAECPQGEFLRHVLPNGYTAIQWWDRTQGDTRGACNSTILMKGEHTTAVMLEALALHFPEVLARLTAAGVVLREVAP